MQIAWGQIHWSPRAIRDLRHVRAYVAPENPVAARAIADAIEVHVERLAAYPRLGHLQTGGFRELVEPRYRYVVRYDLLSDDATVTRVHILSLWHPKQARL